VRECVCACVRVCMCLCGYVPLRQTERKNKIKNLYNRHKLRRCKIVNMYVYVNCYIYVFMYMYIYMHMHTYINYVFIYVYIYIFIFMNMYTYMHTYIYIYDIYSYDAYACIYMHMRYHIYAQRDILIYMTVSTENATSPKSTRSSNSDSSVSYSTTSN